MILSERRTVGERRTPALRTRSRGRGFNRYGIGSSLRSPRRLLSAPLGKIDDCPRRVWVRAALSVNLHMPEATSASSAEPRPRLPKSSHCAARRSAESLGRLESMRSGVGRDDPIAPRGKGGWGLCVLTRVELRSIPPRRGGRSR